MVSPLHPPAQKSQHDKILGHCTRPDLPIALQAMELLVVVFMMREDWENGEKERLVKLSAIRMFLIIVTIDHGNAQLGSTQQEMKLCQVIEK